MSQARLVSLESVPPFVIEQLGDFGQILLTPPLLPESVTQHLL